MDLMPTCKALFLPEVISDHCPTKITLSNERVKEKKSFMFCNMWAQHPQFEVIRDGIQKLKNAKCRKQ